MKTAELRKFTPQEIKAFEIMVVLNESKRQGTDGYYDCGDLGIVHIWWGKYGWKSEWVEISTEFKEAEK